MKPSSDFIWQFIHTLTNAEKTFFRRNFSIPHQKDSTLYLKLFDAIAAQKNYDEKKLLEKVDLGITKKNIAFQKHYLLNQLNNALVEYYSRNNISQEIFKQIQLIRVYRKKGLLDEAHSLWKKAVSSARKAESFSMDSLLKAEFEKMILLSNSHISYDELYAIVNQKIITHSEYTDLIALRDLYAEIVLIKRKVHYDLDDTQKKEFLKMLQLVEGYRQASEGKSFRYRHYYSMSKATLLYLLNRIDEAFSIFQTNLSYWQQSPSFISSNGEHYLELLYMINYAGVACRQYKYVMSAFTHTCNTLIEDRVQRANFEAIKFLAHNRIYNKMAKYSAVSTLIKDMKSQYKQWEPELNNDLNRTINMSLGIASFVLEDYTDAFYFIKNAISYYKEGAREEHNAVGQLLLLLITFEMNNVRLFDAQYRTTYTYFYKRKNKQSFESALIQCLHRSFYMTDTKEKQKEYNKALAVFEENKNNIVQQMASSIFNYPGWLHSKAMRITYRQYVERKVKNEELSPLS